MKRSIQVQAQKNSLEIEMAPEAAPFKKRSLNSVMGNQF
jgi:hypothetical protein